MSQPTAAAERMLERPMDGKRHVFGHALANEVQRASVIRHDLSDQRLRRRRGEWRFAGEHFIQHRSECVLIFQRDTAIVANVLCQVYRRHTAGTNFALDDVPTNELGAECGGNVQGVHECDSGGAGGKRPAKTYRLVILAVTPGGEPCPRARFAA
jgi:hypothetical protein